MKLVDWNEYPEVRQFALAALSSAIRAIEIAEGSREAMMTLTSEARGMLQGFNAIGLVPEFDQGHYMAKIEHTLLTSISSDAERHLGVKGDGPGSSS